MSEWAINNIGVLINAGGFLIVFVGGWYNFRGRLDMLEYRTKSIEDTLKIIATAIEKQTSNEKQIALLDMRIAVAENHAKTVAKEISELRRGDGFIRGPQRTGIDGQYS
jgi:uncharacterized membrane protein